MNYPLGRKPRANQRLYTGVLHLNACDLHEPTEMETDASANISDTTAVVPANDVVQPGTADLEQAT